MQFFTHTGTEADLGMFSMFGQTGAHKKGPHKRTGKFLQYSNMPEIIEIKENDFVWRAGVIKCQAKCYARP